MGETWVPPDFSPFSLLFSCAEPASGSLESKRLRIATCHRNAWLVSWGKSECTSVGVFMFLVESAMQWSHCDGVRAATLMC